MSVLKECAVTSAALFRATVNVRILYRSWRGPRRRSESARELLIGAGKCMAAALSLLSPSAI